MTRIPIPQRLKAQQGTAMVEMALVLPIVLAITLAIVDFGRVMSYWNNVNQIAADGARFAAVDKNPGDDLDTPGVEMDFREWLRRQAVTGELYDGTLAGGDPSHSVTSQLQVCVDPVNGQPLTVGYPIKVTVQSGYNLIPIRMLPGIGSANDIDAVDIRGTAVMRLEQDYTGPTGCFPST